MNSAGVRIASSEELVQGGVVESVVDGNVIAVFRTQDGLFAIDGVCMHQGGPIAKGKIQMAKGHNGNDSLCVTCPWHGWQYDLKTGCNMATGKPMLSVYRVEEIDGQILLYRA
jgi:nitrite reductase (NADH) small subunit